MTVEFWRRPHARSPRELEFWLSHGIYCMQSTPIKQPDTRHVFFSFFFLHHKEEENNNDNNAAHLKWEEDKCDKHMCLAASVINC